MTSSSIARACGFALLTLTALPTLACTEPSGTGGTLDAPPSAAITADAPAGLDPADPIERTTEPPEQDPVPDSVQAGSDAAIPEAEVVEEPEQPVVPLEPYKVLILGDSLAATGFGVLLEKKLDAHPHVVAYRKAKSATGLARPDFYDWFDQGFRQVEFRKPDLVIVVMGGNDGQDIPPWKGSSRVRWDTEDWPSAYRGRVDDFLAKVMTPIEGEDSARILWLGLPRMGMRSLEKKLVLIRQIQVDAVASLGADGSYLDTTQFLIDEDGELLPSAPVQGKNRELRAEDGIHFTMSGSEYLADKVYPEVLSALGLPTDSPADPPADPPD